MGPIEGPVCLPRYVALEASVDFLFGFALACPFGDVVAGGKVPVHSDEGDGKNGLVELAVPSAV